MPKMQLLAFPPFDLPLILRSSFFSLLPLRLSAGPAITMLHMFLASPRPALRFAAVRTLHKLAAAHAPIVAKCNVSNPLEQRRIPSQRQILHGT